MRTAQQPMRIAHCSMLTAQYMVRNAHVNHFCLQIDVRHQPLLLRSAQSSMRKR